MASGVAISALVLAILLLILVLIGIFIYYSNLALINQDIADLQNINLIIPTMAITLTSSSSNTSTIIKGDTVYLVNGVQPNGFQLVISVATGGIGRPFYVINETGSPLAVVVDTANNVAWGNAITVVNMSSTIGSSGAKTTASFVYDTDIVVYYISLGNQVTTNLLTQ